MKERFAMNDAETARKYGTTNPVLIEARINHDPYDEFAWVQGWRFAIAQRLEDIGEFVPNFRGADDIRDDLEYELTAGCETGEDDADMMWYALRILDRYREWLRIAGKDY